MVVLCDPKVDLRNQNEAKRAETKSKVVSPSKTGLNACDLPLRRHKSENHKSENHKSENKFSNVPGRLINPF